MGLSWVRFRQIHIVHLYSKAVMVNNDIYEEVAVPRWYLRVVLNQDNFDTWDRATHIAIKHYLFVMQ